MTMADWIEWHDGDSEPHPDSLIEVDYHDEAVRETRLAAGTPWRDVRRYRVLRLPPAVAA